MQYRRILSVLGSLSLLPGPALGFFGLGEPAINTVERQFRELPPEDRRLTGPLFWLHGDESQARLESYIGKVAEGGNGCFTAESRPHSDWLGPNWFRDLGTCLEAAKKHDLKMWIFDEEWWPSQGIGGHVPPQYAAKRLHAEAVEVNGPGVFEAEGHGGERYVATVAGRVTAEGQLAGDSLVDLAPHIRHGHVNWPVPAGRWQVMKFTHVQAPGLGQHGGKQLSVDGASRDCVAWFLQTVYQPHYDHFKADFGKTIPGFFYDEPETRGDWGTELNVVLMEWGVDWKKAYVAHAFALAGEEQAAAAYQYRDALAEAWGRTMYGGMTRWCHRHGVLSIGHFMEHGNLYLHPEFCAGDMMRLQRHSDMGAIDAVFTQFAWGQREPRNPPTWQTPKLASSISHVFGKRDDVAMVEIFGARGQDLSYPEMKWWADHMQVSGVNFLIPHSFNPRAPYDRDCPPYFYNGGFEPRWPLYRVFADYTSRLSVLLSGGRHVCPVALLFGGNARQVGQMVGPEGLSEALQDALFDCDWLPFDVFENEAQLSGRDVQLHQERYQALVVPPVEVIPQGTLTKALQFFERGGVVVGYGFLPSKSATLGQGAADIAALRQAIWGEAPQPGVMVCKTNAAGGRSYFLPEKPTVAELTRTLAGEADVPPVLEVLAGDTGNWLHALHRVKAGRDVYLICNQNTNAMPRRFSLLARAEGVPECWDAMRNEITSVPFERVKEGVKFELTLEPLESVLLVFREKSRALPARAWPQMPALVLNIQPEASATAVADPEIPARPGPVTRSPVQSNVFNGSCHLPAGVDLAKCRVYLELDELTPEAAACIEVNGQYAGGFLGRPFRLDVTAQLKPGANTIRIAPFAPKAARLVCVSADGQLMKF